ncbi:MAG: beta-ketoacyl-ACP synthase III [Deltaproteobacteria bacterium]|nr:beta-ketoacyl-ACP synthase III [Deltaproteobacteria bacterium]
MNAFITAISAFLPGEPVDNEYLDDYLGEVSGISARIRRIILANNGIKTRYYALDPETGKTTHTNAQMTAQAIRLLRPDTNVSDLLLQSLCCGTSTPDQIMPAHGSMVHGELPQTEPCEVVSTAGICLSGVTALKFAAMSVASEITDNAVATGSELVSTYLRAQFFQAMSGCTKEKTKKNRHSAFSFEAEFLRWMLSDGAGAMLIEKKPKKEGVSLQIDWIEIISHAHRLETCMYAGAVKEKNGNLLGWREVTGPGVLEKSGVMTIKQDSRLLNKEIIRASIAQSLPSVIAKYGLKPTDVDWFLPHYSSEYFREPLTSQLHDIDFPIPGNQWFTNLSTKGNTGSASFYIMLEELFSSGRLQKGEHILGMIPESGRFSVGWILLTVV